MNLQISDTQMSASAFGPSIERSVKGVIRNGLSFIVSGPRGFHRSDLSQLGSFPGPMVAPEKPVPEA